MQTDNGSSTTRRRALGQLAGAGTLGATTAVAVAATVDPHIAWAREAEALDAKGRILADEKDSERCFLAAADIDRRICLTAAGTREGAIALLGAVDRVLCGFDDAAGAGLRHAISVLRSGSAG
jgi:hypothetical protein